MDKTENFQQLRRKVLWMFENKNEIPTEVEQTIQEMFNKLKAKYQDMGCYTSNIQEYMQGNLDELLARLQRHVGNRRKDKQYEDIQDFLLTIESKLEDELDNEEQKRRDIQNRDRIGKIGKDAPANIRTSLNTVDLIEDSLRDIQSRQLRNLGAREENYDRIQMVEDEIRGFIRRLRNQKEEEIHNEYQVDDSQLRQEILQAFEEYVIERDKEKDEPSKADEFRAELFAGISLEQQSINAQQFLKEGQEEDKEQEQLPEVFLD